MKNRILISKGSLQISFFLLLSFLIKAQSSKSTFDGFNLNDDKPIIDTGIIDRWPYLESSSPTLSPNCDYAAYLINNKPLNGKSLVFQSIHKSIKREIIASYIENDFFFTSDNKKLFWQNSDTLCFLNINSGKIDYILNVTSFKYPRYKRGEWLAYKVNSSTGNLILLNLNTGIKMQFSNVQDYLFNDVGTMFLVKAEFKRNSTIYSSLQWVTLADFKLITIWNDTNRKANGFGFDRFGNQLSFIVTNANADSIINEIWYYKIGMEKAILKVNHRMPSFPIDLIIKNAVPKFSANGNWLFFGLQKNGNNEKSITYGVKVDIWSYKDKTINSEQTLKDLMGVIGVLKGSVPICIEESDEQIITSPESVNGDYVVVKDEIFSERWWPLGPTSSYWLVSLKDGKKDHNKIIKRNGKYPLTNFSFSPGGKWLVYWDCETKEYISYSLKNGISRSITSLLPPVYVEDATGTDVFPVEPIAGWYVDDTALLIYDKYDLWKIDPSGLRSPINLTGEYGAKNQVMLRLVYDNQYQLGENLYIGNEPQLLSGFNTLNKYNGFYLKNLSVKCEPSLLAMMPYSCYKTSSQIPPNGGTFDNGMQPVKGGSGKNVGWIVQMQSAVDYPNYFFTYDFINYKPLTDLQPQKKYNWLTTELITWKQLDGTLSQGVLYKPENFDPNNKYPVIFNYYEKLSHRLYEFPMPGLTYDNINIPWFVSRGYLVFTPDIHYKIGSISGKVSGEWVYNSVVSAAEHLAKLPFVDSQRMAIQGHSFGGGETFSLIVRTNVFAAACAVASTVSDEVSAYLGFKRINGKPPREFRLSHAETGHDMIGATLWERPDLYLQASPIFKADKVTTPLLILHNMADESCDWGQSAEMYMALRRLGKKVWMLQYDREGHSLEMRENALDFTIRLTQFFDYYLKRSLPPKWMTKSIPAWKKGLDSGLDLETNSIYIP